MTDNLTMVYHVSYYEYIFQRNLCILAPRVQYACSTSSLMSLAFCLYPRQ